MALVGGVVPDAGETITEVGWEWGVDVSPSPIVFDHSLSLGTGTSLTASPRAVDMGLAPGTAYVLRGYAKYDPGGGPVQTAYSASEGLAVPGAPSVGAAEIPPAGITATSAGVRAYVAPGGLQYEYRLQCSTPGDAAFATPLFTTAYATGGPADGNSGLVTTNPLDAYTSYLCRIGARSGLQGGESAWGAATTFTTADPPRFSTAPRATSTTGTGAAVAGDLDVRGFAVTSSRFVYWPAGQPASSREASGGTLAAGTPHTTDPRTLTAPLPATGDPALAGGTRYTMRLEATTAEGTTQSNVASFWTRTGVDAPAVTAQAGSGDLVSVSLATGVRTPPQDVGETQGLDTTYRYEWRRRNTDGSWPATWDTSASPGTLPSGLPGVPRTAAGTLSLDPASTYQARLVAVNADAPTDGTTGAALTFTTLAPPGVGSSTGAPAAGDPTRVDLTVQVNPHGRATTAWFEWASVPSASSCAGATFTATPAQSVGDSTIPAPVNASISSLTPGQTLCFRAKAQNADGTTAEQLPGGPNSVLVGGSPPAVSTTAASGVTATAALLTGTINTWGTPGTSYWFEYSTQRTPDDLDLVSASETTHTAAPFLAGGYPVAATAGSLTPSTTYWFRLVGQSAAGTTRGTLQTFTTPGLAPVVTNLQPDQVVNTGAQLRGTVNPNGAGVAVCRFEWFTSAPADPPATPTPDGTANCAQDAQTIGTGTSPRTVSAAVTGLTPNTPYWYRLVAGRDAGSLVTALPAELFTTGDAPTITIAAPSGVGLSTATITGTVNPNGVTTSWQVVYGTDPGLGPGSSRAPVPAQDAGNGRTPVSISQSLTGLEHATTYYARIEATNTNARTSASTTQSFTTSGPPAVLVGSASNVQATSATLIGSVNPHGKATTCSYRWGLTNNPASWDPADETTPVSVGSGSTFVGCPSAVTPPLQPATTYYFLVKATNADGTTESGTSNFTTAAPPSVTTLAGTAGGADTATLRGSVNPRSRATTWWFEYSLDQRMIGSLSTAPVDAGAGGATVAVTGAVTGLAPATTYWYRMAAHNDQGTVYGVVMSVTTKAPPVAVTGASSAVGEGGATLDGEVTPRGLTTRWSFEYGTDAALAGAQRSPDRLSGTAPGQAVREAVTGLTAGTVYYYRLRAENADGVSLGEIRTFTTTAAPRGTTLDAAEVTAGSALLRAEGAGRGPGAEYCFYWAENPSLLGPVETDHAAMGDGFATESLSRRLEGLKPGTTYYYRVWVSNRAGWVMGDVKSFTTRSPPDAALQDAADVSTDRATVRGLVFTRGRATRYRFEWGTSPSLQGATTVPMAAAGSGETVNVSRRLEGLKPGTTYYYRLLVESGEGAGGTGIGNLTTQELPQAVALSPIRLTRSGATLRGKVVSTDSATWWFEWGLYPSRLDRRTAAQAMPPSPGPRRVEADVTGLAPGSTFYYRLVVKSSQGTVTGDTRTQTTLAPPTVMTVPPLRIERGAAVIGGRIYTRRQRTFWWFQWGTSKRFGQHTQPVVLAGRARAADVSVRLANLRRGVTYHFRLVGESRAGTTYGMRQTVSVR